VSEVELFDQVAAPGELEAESIERLDLRRAVLTLDPRARELIALRYGADLKARQIAELLGERTNTVEVALHRALDQLRSQLEPEEEEEVRRPRAPEPSKPRYTAS
jgi:RNA polymerase sigma-70 factor, ECF subfamily